MLLRLIKKENSHAWNYPDAPELFEAQYSELGELFAKYKGSKTLAELQTVAPCEEVTAIPTGERIISKRAFLSRMPASLKAQLFNAKKNDPMIDALLFELSVSDEVDLDLPDLVGGLDYLISQGLLTAGQKAELLI